MANNGARGIITSLAGVVASAALIVFLLCAADDQSVVFVLGPKRARTESLESIGENAHRIIQGLELSSFSDSQDDSSSGQSLSSWKSKLGLQVDGFSHPEYGRSRSKAQWDEAKNAVNNLIDLNYVSVLPSNFPTSFAAPVHGPDTRVSKHTGTGMLIYKSGFISFHVVTFASFAVEVRDVAAERSTLRQAMLRKYEDVSEQETAKVAPAAPLLHLIPKMGTSAAVVQHALSASTPLPVQKATVISRKKPAAADQTKAKASAISHKNPAAVDQTKAKAGA